MAASGVQRIRKGLFIIHQWLGLGLFVLLIPLCLSGLVLMWPDAVNNLTDPPPKVGSASTSLPLARYVDSARAALPAGWRVQSIRTPQAAGEAVTVSAIAADGRGGETVWLDPASGAALKVGSPQSPLWQVAHSFHETLTLGQTGRPLVGLLGFTMLYFSLSGLWLWWPRGALSKGWSWRRTPTTLMNLHYLGGFWVAIPLAVVALTGAGLSFPQQTAVLFGGAQQRPEGAPAGAEARGGRGQGGQGQGGEGRGGQDRGGQGRAGTFTPMLSPDQAAAAALALHPGAQLLDVVLPGQRLPGPPIPPPPGGGPRAWRVQLSQGGRTLDLWVADAGGVAADAAAPMRQPGGNGPGLVRSLHQGDGGWVWKALVALTGLVPVVLAITGVWTWIRLELRRRAARAA